MIKKPGFTLIELSIALVIVSIISLMLYQSFYQTQRTVKTVDSLMDYTLLVPTVYNQIEKDLTAIFVPEVVFKELLEKEQKKNKKESEKKKEIKPFGAVFQAQLKEKQLVLFSFLSTHSLSLYDTVVPYNVRVLYRLMPQEDGLYRLTRQEATDLAMKLKKFEKEKIRSYDLLTNIKQLSVRFFVPEKLELPKQEKKGEQKPKKEESQEKKKRVYKEFVQWVPDEMSKKTDYLVPAFIQLSGSVIDPVTKRERSFEWEFEVFAFDGIEERLKATKQVEQKPAPGPNLDERLNRPAQFPTKADGSADAKK